MIIVNASAPRRSDILYKVDFEGDGVVDLETEDGSNITHTYDTPGIYYPTIRITDQYAQQYSETTLISVLDKAQMDALLKGKWEGMKGALIAKDVDSAMNYFIDGQNSKYKSAFVELKDQLPVIFSAAEEMRLVSANDGQIEYDNIVLQGDIALSFPIVFVRDENGLWKIQQF